MPYKRYLDVSCTLTSYPPHCLGSLAGVIATLNNQRVYPLNMDWWLIVFANGGLINISYLYHYLFRWVRNKNTMSYDNLPVGDRSGMKIMSHLGLDTPWWYQAIYGVSIGHPLQRAILKVLQICNPVILPSNTWNATSYIHWLSCSGHCSWLAFTSPNVCLMVTQWLGAYEGHPWVLV